jgi:hypothetical protein
MMTVMMSTVRQKIAQIRDFMRLPSASRVVSPIEGYGATRVLQRGRSQRN